MRLEQTPRPEQTVRVSAKLITSSTILQLSADEFERSINQEQVENPTFEVVEQRVCLFCGTRMYGQLCPACGQQSQLMRLSPRTPQIGEAQASYEAPQWPVEQPVFYDIDNAGFSEADSDVEFDPLTRIPTGETLVETLLQQLEALVPPEDTLIAEQLVGNLNERGYLEIGIEEIAAQLAVPVERVAYVLSQLQTLEPPGIGARNLRECLLIQLQTLSEWQEPHPLAYALIDNYLDLLGRNQLHEIARRLKVSEQEVHAASLYIRSTLHPFPALIYRDGETRAYLGNGTSYLRPDIIIRKGESGYEVELIEEKRYHFEIKTDCTEAGTPASLPPAPPEVLRYVHHQSDRARFFIDCVYRRWRTLKRVAELVIDYQREFLEKGVRYLRPLTRAEVATRLNLDEGTVSRATAGKYVLLPNGRLIPLADFFDGSLGIKDMIRELIQSEEPRHRLSDDEIARLLTLRGISVARRTVTKYREAMGIGSSRER
ncbi:MAG: RNA polymerase factor sigma-54 [Ktedonobacteraceae bacterium]|nr:RNA polymerase factor sigma-54 [Ktedonobacteraceae bacterium]